MSSETDQTKSIGGRILAAVRALLVRLAILVVTVVVTWPFISKYAISHGVNAIIAYYWIIGSIITLMVLHWLYGKLRPARGPGR
jgi:hypothetical protein